MLGPVHNLVGAREKEHLGQRDIQELKYIANPDLIPGTTIVPYLCHKLMKSQE